MNAAKVEARDTIYQRMKAGEYIREELTPDGLHPNDKGHKLVAEEIEKFLESVKAELEVEEKEPVFPKAMTENAYENAKRLTIREISPKLCGFHADTEEKAGHLDHFKNGWIGKKAGDSIHLGDCFLQCSGEKKIHTVDITILPEEVTDTTPFYLMSLIIA